MGFVRITTSEYPSPKQVHLPGEVREEGEGAFEGAGCFKNDPCLACHNTSQFG